MSEQMDLFELEHTESFQVVTSSVRVLREKGFENILPLGVDKQYRSGYRAVYEGQGCTVNIDSEGYIMFKHDNSRFWDYGGEV